MFVFLGLTYLTSGGFFSSSTHLPANFMFSFFIKLNNTPLCKCTTYFLVILQLRDKSFDLQFVLPAKCAGAKVSIELMGMPNQ